MRIIRNSVDYCLTFQYEDGNFPSMIGKKDDMFVDFEAGATGAIPFLISAYNTFKEEKYMDSLIRAGNLIWERGIVKKGNGICFGITGNAYALHSIYRLRKDDLWLGRCLLFAMATFDNNIQKSIRNFDDPTRMTVGMADTPFSLMEGLGGELVFFTELLS